MREPVTHDLKCWPEPFAAMQSGEKTAEFRRDDREGVAMSDMQCPNCGDDPPFAKSGNGVWHPDEECECQCGARLIVDADDDQAHLIWANEEDMGCDDEASP